MSKKITFILFLSVFLFLGVRFAYAEVVINEVQIAGSTANDEFIELYNSGDSVADLTGFYIKKKTSTGSESNLVVSDRFEGVTISSGDYFLLARENEYAGDVSPDIFWPSSYSLANNNSLTLYRGNEADKDEVRWETIGENKSIQRTTTNSWITATPTPGTTNETISVSQSNNDNDENVSTTTPAETKPKVTGAPTIKAKIIASTLAFSGQPLEMKTSVLGFSNENVVLGRVYWNFGDGGSFEQINNFEKFYHTYYYPGEYVVFLEYYSSSFSKVPEASNKIIIKVVPIAVSISRVGDKEDFFIELSNDTNYEIDISNWSLSSFNRTFILPKNSSVLAKKKMIISSKTTGFSIEDKNTLKLMTPQREVISNYLTSIFAPIKAVSTKNLNKETEVSPKVSTNQNQTNLGAVKLPEEISILDKQVPVENLGASIVQSNAVGNNSIRTYFLTTILTVFLGLSAGAVYFIRQKKIVAGAGDDFKILDE
ncbi:MAG: hypothetical protein US18_C0017G0024 [Parcubacteria group bacterium GW2011_GWB1_36_5]|nr:MAG: hypothetical protein US18_C0017G0024 [Parcubacteria group bacterium GW2011_GWB1_36_5]